MPSGVIAGYFSYPALSPLISGSYTCSHGISPGIITLRVHPANVSPVGFGNVVIGDGRKSLTLRDCKLIRFTGERADSGVDWLIELEDTRWRWKSGRIDGEYNQLDPNSKLIPRRIKSPTELANLCLDAMGVRRRIVDMPDGILGAAFANTIPEFLPVGINFPPTGINPPVSWFAENPAGALAALAERVGRRVVYDPIDDRVLVVRPGIGDALPDGHVHNVTPSLVLPETPDAVQVVGDPTRFEGMLEMYAVGRDWDKSIRPINELSYAPKLPGRKHIVKYTVNKVIVSQVYGFRIEAAGITTPVYFTHGCIGGDTTSTIVDDLKNQINTTQDPALKGKLIATTTTDTLIITGNKDGFLYDIVIDSGDGRESVVIKQVGASERGCWDFCPPPLFPNLKATDRLTRLQALKLAQESVFKMYRLTGRDASTLKTGINVPGYGTVLRPDIVISDVCCDQVVPEAGDKKFIDVDKNALIRSLYDGYSRDKPAEVYGSVCRTCIDTSEFWYIGSGTVNAGAAAIGGLAPPEFRAMSFDVKRVAVGTVYFLLIAAPGTTGTTFFHVGIGGDTVAIILADLKTQIDATTDSGLNGKLSTAIVGDKLIVTSLVGGLLFSMDTATAPDIATVSTVKTGSGLPPPTPTTPPPNVSPAVLMTPPGVGKGSSINTDPSDRVYVDFHVDATWQFITFSSPVWYAAAGLRIEAPKLFLRCACQVRNKDTQQLIAFSDTHIFRPGKAVHVARHQDIQLNVIGDYTIVRKKDDAGDAAPGGPQYVWQLKRTRLLEADAILRARYYLIAELLQFQIKGGVVTDYNGIEPVRMDGKTFQVTYRVEGGVGTMTTASVNMEHSTWLLPYPQRRRAENLAAVARNVLGQGRVNNPGAGNAGSQNPNPTG